MGFNVKKFITNFLKEQIKQVIEEHGDKIATKAGEAAATAVTDALHKVNQKVQ